MINTSIIHIIGYHLGEKLNLDCVKTTLNFEVVKSDSVFLLFLKGMLSIVLRIRFKYFQSKEVMFLS